MSRLNETEKPRSFFTKLSQKIPLQIAVLFAPLAYCIHQLEETALNFRDWRELYFDPNPLPVIYMFVILTALTLTFILIFLFRKSKPSVHIVLLLFMATQVHNVFYHAGTSIYFMHFSPGVITGLLLYLPLNVFICGIAIAEKWVSIWGVFLLFVLGGIGFWTFEFLGPVIMGLVVALAVVYLILYEILNKKKSEKAAR
jgi:hypothetical protein